jgi:hypothetical protein
LPNGAAGGPDDAYCSGAHSIKSVANADMTSVATGVASLAAATRECQYPEFKNDMGASVAVAIVDQEVGRQFQSWYDNRVDRRWGSWIRVRVEAEGGPWNDIFSSTGYVVKQWLFFVAASIQFPIATHTRC